MLDGHWSCIKSQLYSLIKPILHSKQKVVSYKDQTLTQVAVATKRTTLLTAPKEDGNV